MVNDEHDSSAGQGSGSGAPGPAAQLSAAGLPLGSLGPPTPTWLSSEFGSSRLQDRSPASQPAVSWGCCQLPEATEKSWPLGVTQLGGPLPRVSGEPTFLTSCLRGSLVA